MAKLDTAINSLSANHAYLKMLYPKTAASPEQCSSDCAPSTEAFPREAVTAPAALFASRAVDHIQVGSSDI